MKQVFRLNVDYGMSIHGLNTVHTDSCAHVCRLGANMSFEGRGMAGIVAEKSILWTTGHFCVWVAFVFCERATGVEGLPAVLLHGEVRRATLHVSNQGAMPLTGLTGRLSHPSFCVLLAPDAISLNACADEFSSNL